MTETASSPNQPNEPFAHYPRGRASAAEIDEAAAFMHRVTKRPVAVARSLFAWAEEVVLCRNADGALTGAHGFRFMDVQDGRGAFRLVYAVFSHSALTGKTKAQQAGQVGVRVYGRERKEHANAAIVWVNAPGCDSDLSFATGALRPVRRLVPGTHSRLPQNMRFYTDEVGETETAPIPALVDDAVAQLLREQREREGDAAMGRNILRPSWTKLVAGLSAAAAAAAAFLLLPHRSTDEVMATANREKGGPTLRVYRQKESGGGEELISGGPAFPGDRVKFAVDLPATQRVRVIGVEADGDLYQAWPSPGTTPADLITAGRGWVLDGATVLDESRGRETLYLVSCPPDLQLPICVSQGAGQPPLCPGKCELSPFVLDKTTR
jgi:hypothetical protein